MKFVSSLGILYVLIVQEMYYSAGYDPICIHCASEDATELIETDHHYPICLTCRKEKEPIAKRKKK